jgi:DNA-binding NarL/FixJ family response regulator
LRQRHRQSADENPCERLARRECDVLRQLGRGLSNKEIARTLNLSDATVKNHVHIILAKLNVRRRAEALARLRQQPWIVRVG